MPELLENATTHDGYVPQVQIGPVKNCLQVNFLITGADVYVKLWKPNPSDSIGSPVEEGVERFYPAGSGDSFSANISGAKFRSATPGVPATVQAQLAYKTDPVSTLGFTATGAQLNPGVVGVETTDGAIDVNPTTVLRIGAGITLTNPATGEAQLDATGSGIQFDTDNEGGLLYVETNGPVVSPFTAGIALVDESGGGIQIQSTDVPSAPTTIRSGSIAIGGADSLDLNSDGAYGPVNIGNTNTLLSKVGFFGVSAVGQQPTPVTLGDAISGLQAYGLFA